MEEEGWECGGFSSYSVSQIQQVLTVDGRRAEVWQKPLALAGSRYTEACWPHKQEEAFCALIQALPLLTCFLPSLHEFQPTCMVCLVMSDS